MSSAVAVAGRLGRRRTAWAVTLIALGAVADADAHPAPFSFVDLHLQSTTLEISVVIHSWDVAHELDLDSPNRALDASVLIGQSQHLGTLVRDRLRVTVDGRTLEIGAWADVEPVPERQSLRLRSRHALAGVPGVVAVTADLFPYDPVHQTFLNYYEDQALMSQAILDAGKTEHEFFVGSNQGRLAVVQRFVPSGIHHILIGPDHILFLIGLLLLGGSVRRLTLVVTAFTIAHSITLSLAVLNILAPSARLVEPAIALSIVYVGVDNLLVRGGRDMRVWIALAFGLIHGFGFAGVLREMGLPREALGWSLFAFNVGVEIGQLLVVVVVASALAAFRAWSATASRRLAYAGSVVVIAAGTFWFVQRVFFSGPA